MINFSIIQSITFVDNNFVNTLIEILNKGYNLDDEP